MLFGNTIDYKNMQKKQSYVSVSSWFYYQVKNSKEKIVYAKRKGVKNNRLITVIETKNIHNCSASI